MAGENKRLTNITRDQIAFVLYATLKETLTTDEVIISHSNCGVYLSLILAGHDRGLLTIIRAEEAKRTVTLPNTSLKNFWACLRFFKDCIKDFECVFKHFLETEWRVGNKMMAGAEAKKAVATFLVSMWLNVCIYSFTNKKGK